MSHTPGPWRTELYDWDECPSGVGQRMAVIRQPKGDVDIAYVPVDEDDGEMRDNESLIAAAPDLLAACEELLIYLGDWDDMDNDTCAAARKAIAKAKGVNQ